MLMHDKEHIIHTFVKFPGSEFEKRCDLRNGDGVLLRIWMAVIIHTEPVCGTSFL